MSNFKLGDKVRAKHNAPYGITTNGWVGEVVKICNNNNMVVHGKGACGKKKDGCGFTVSPMYFEKVCDNKVVITTDGITTTAKLYDGKTVVKTAEAKCAPDDEFNFETGARIAFNRLTGYIESILDATFDWDEFKAGKIAVKVTKNNFKSFVAEAKKHGLKFNDESFNPFGTSIDSFMRFMAVCVGMKRDVKENEIYIMCQNNSLKIGHFLAGLKEFIWK